MGVGAAEECFLDEESSVKLMTRAWRDEAFKQELMSNPSRFIEQELGQKIQESIRFQVCAETVKKLFIVLPSISIEMLAEQLAIDEVINMPVIAGSGDIAYQCQAFLSVCGSNDRGTVYFTTPRPV